MNTVDLVQNLILKQRECSQDYFSNCPFPIYFRLKSVLKGVVYLPTAYLTSSTPHDICLSKNVQQLDTYLQLHALWLLVRGLYISKNTSIHLPVHTVCMYTYDAKTFTTDLHSYLLLVTEQPYNLVHHCDKRFRHLALSFLIRHTSSNHTKIFI